MYFVFAPWLQVPVLINDLLNHSYQTIHSIETKQVRPSEWTVESLAHSIRSTPCCYALLYKTNSTFVFAASRTCADIQKSTLLVNINEYKN